jgi:hypothetical protein
MIGSAVILAGLTLAPALVAAQHSMAMPKHEVGVDIALAYIKPSGGSGVFAVMTPVDVRLGFVMQNNMTLEPRIGLQFQSGGGASAHDINLDLNLTKALGAGTYRKGAYFTVGAGAEFLGSTGTSGGTLISFNGGIGTRSTYESGAIRLEGFVQYGLKNTTLLVPSTLAIGARVGLSLWH